MSFPTTVEVAGHKVGRIGFGLMQLTWNPKPPAEEVSFAAMKAAADAGSTIWSSACFYGNPGDNFANIKLIAKFFAKYPEYKDKIILVVKGGNDYKTLAPQADIDYARKELIEAQKILGDKKIDIYSYSRLPNQPVETSFNNLATLQKEGLFGAVAASEMGVESLKKAAKIVPIALVEIEVSLFSFEPAIQEVIAYSKEVGLPVFCYSPFSRGFLTRTYKSPDDIPAGDFKKFLPRFQGEAFYENLKLVDKLDEIAAKKGVQTPQLALAWITNLSPYTIPIPGSSNADRVRENVAAGSIQLTPDETKEINSFLEKFQVKGTRYPAMAMGVLMK